MITFFVTDLGTENEKKYPIGKKHKVLRGPRRTVLHHQRTGLNESFPKARVDIVQVPS